MDRLRERLFPGVSEMAQRMRDFDWSQTPLGPVEGWPQSLRMAVGIMLTSRQPIWLGWGRQLIKLYNDPYKAIVGGKHPAALGQPAAVVWREIWHEIGPMLQTAMGGLEGTYVEEQLLIMERNGYKEETYYTFSYSPILDDSGRAGGIICANTDDTPRVLGERQLALLRELAAKTADARTVQHACELSIRCLATNPRDLPFALIYLFEADARRFVLAGQSAAIPVGHPSAPSEVAMDADSPWPFAEVLATNQPCMVSDLDRFGPDLPAGAWDRAPHHAAAVPIAARGRDEKAGILVVGLNPYRLFDVDYRGFLDLIASQIAASIANALAYEEERKRSDALAEIDRAKTAFFSNVSHEFRTPLTLMLGPLEDALARDGDLSEAAREQLEIARRNGTRLLKLVNTLLDFSRIEAGRIDASFEPLDLAAFTTDLASLFRSAIDKAGMSLTVDCPVLPQLVYVDREMWEKIVLNLISNAFNFTFEGGIEVRLREHRSMVELSVSDTGTGIPAEELPHIFERFHRVKNSKGRTIEGSGIGLSLVRELVRLHGGDVRVTSRLDEGSTFTVSIPFGSAHLPAARIGVQRTRVSTALGADAYVQEALSWLPAPGRQPEHSFKSFMIHPGADLETSERTARRFQSRILLADDNADTREYVRRLLSEIYDVVTVSDGEAALDAASRQSFDLILTDVMMPKADGFTVLRELRANKRTATIPVIMLSARAGEESRIAGLNTGADDYLVKPFSARELLARVSARLEISRLRRENEQRVLNILESLNDAFQAIDADGRFTYANPAAKRLREEQGLLDDMVGRHVFDVFPEARESDFGHAFKRAMTERVPVEVNSFYPPFQRWYNVRFFPMPEGGLSVFSQDITARHLAESQRAEALENERNARQQAEQANRLKDEFLATVSHELRTPLNHILGWVTLLQSGKVSAERAREALATIERNAKAQNHLIEDLLDVSRAITGKLGLDIQPVRLADVVESAVASARPAAQAKGIRLVSNLEPNVESVNGDPERLQQVVWNLVSNAIKFTHEGGRVTVRLSKFEGHVRLSVIDTGEGISPEFLPHVFNRFTQADGSYRRRHGGLGLGLAIVRHLVEMHGGEVSVESAGLGKGSTFSVTLPLPRSDASEAMGRSSGAAIDQRDSKIAPPVAPPVPRLEGVKALVVDDEEDTQEIVSALLAMSGIEVRRAANAAEGLAVFSSWSPDIIIADIGMPGEDGYELIRRIRQTEAASDRPATPAVALTAYARPEDRVRALAAGYQQHLPKPFEPSDLWRAVSTLTGRLDSNVA